MRTEPPITELEKALMAAAAANDTQRINQLLNETALSEFKDHFTRKLILAAAEHGHLDLLNSLLTPENIENHEDVLSDALVESAGNGHLAVVKELLTYQTVKDNIATNNNEALRSAAQNGHLNIVKEMLIYPAVKDNVTAINNRVLRVAAEYGHHSIVKELLTYQAVKNNVAANHNSALKLAAQNGHLAVVKELLTYQAVKDKVAIDDDYALRIAAENGHLAVVKELLSYQAVKNKVAANNNKALRKAAKHGNVKELLIYQAVKDNVAADNNYALRKAAKYGHLAVVKELLIYQAVKDNIAAYNNGALISAAQNGHLAVMKELLTYQAVKDDVAANYNSALSLAAQSGHLAVVKELLTYQAVRKNITADDNYALRLAAENGHLAVVKELLTYPAVRKAIATDDNCALKWAAAKGHLTVVKELLTYQAVRKNITANDNEAFKWAAGNGHLAVMKELLTYQAVKDDVTAWYNSALRLAAKNGHLSVVKELLTYPAVRKAIATDNNYALRYAACNGHLAVMKELLIYQAVKDNVSVLNNEALRCAVENDHLAVVKELLTYQAVRKNITADDNYAFRWAAKNGHIDVVRRLLKEPEVMRLIDIDNNVIFSEAAEFGNILVVLELLKHPIVREKAAANNNYALSQSVYEGNIEVVKALLELPVVRNALTFEQAMNIIRCKIKLPDTLLDTLIAKSCLNQKALLRIAKQLEPEHVGEQSLLLKYLAYYGYDEVTRELKGAQWIAATMLNYLAYFGYDQSNSELKGAELIAAIKRSIKTSFSDPFLNPQAHAGAILQLDVNIKDLKQSTYEDLAENSESAMDESLLVKANERFNEKIKPAFEKQFTSLEDIEKKLCELLLNKKLSQEITPEARNFIEQNKAALIERDPTILAQSRPYFNSLTDTLDIAWRALDASAPTHGWEKLFVAPPSDKEKNYVFSTGATHQGSLNLLQTTQITRERLCYAYLVATDPELTKEEREEASNKLVFYLAEISRAHNEHDALGSDNPSCFPGTITRLDLIFQAHPKFTVPHNLFDLTHNIARQLVVRKFGAALEKASDKRALYEAVTLFSDINAREIIHKPDSVLDTEGEKADLGKLLNIRKEFYSQVFGENGEDGVCFINNKLLEEFNLSLDEETNIIALNAFINMSGKETAFSITEAYQRVVPPVIEARVLANPYRISLEKIFEVLKHVPDALKERIAQQRYDHAQLKAADFDLIFDRLKIALSEISFDKIFDAAKTLVDARFNETELEQVLANLSEELAIPVESLKTRCAFLRSSENMDVEIAPLAPVFLPQQNARKRRRETDELGPRKSIRVVGGYELRGAIARP